jgi:hypothetical protein
VPEVGVGASVRSSLSAVVIRADGSREDLGLVSETKLEPNAFVRLLALFDPRTRILIHKARRR